MDIGIISEGVTDQIIIEAIVQGHLENKDIILEPLQPKKGEDGGWSRVVEYCKSKDFKESFPFRDGFTIIHIDCDVFKGNELPEDCKWPLDGLGTQETCVMVRSKLLQLIGLNADDEISVNIVFAIAVDSIECWLLPLYFENAPKTMAKTSGCIGALNKVLPETEGFYIHQKKPDDYSKMARHYRKKKNVAFSCKQNESLNFFVDNLESQIQSYNKN